MKNSPPRIRVGITMGDPAGIGPVIIRKATAILDGLAQFVVIGDKKTYERTDNRKQGTGNCTFIDLENVKERNFSFGKIRPEYGQAAREYLEKALELIQNKEIDCLVTGPISKEAVSKSGFSWPGQTEYLAERSGIRNFAMMLMNKKIKTVLVSRHVALRDVPRQITRNKIYRTSLLAFQAFREFFFIKEPRMVVCGLNPHGSDNGLLGDEENKIIQPAVRSLRKKIKYLDGPLPSDVAIARSAQGKYDCVVTMYHDQALIPLKILDSRSGVNLTLGLSFIRTSPLHGTAFDIAGDFRRADPSSLVEAVKVAVWCASCRQKKK